MSPKKLAGITIAVVLSVSVWFFSSLWLHGLRFYGSSPIRYDVTGQVGDFIGGIIGTIINAAAFYFLYLTLKEQRLSFERERFESKFFDLIKIHRDNVAELSYSKPDGISYDKSEGRKVLKVIFEEFLECYREIKKFSRDMSTGEIILPKYEKELKNIIASNNLKCTSEDMALIDIAYSILFFGLGNIEEVVLRNRFSKCYVNTFFYRLITYMKLKPKQKHSQEFQQWATFKSLKLSKLKAILEEIYSNRNELIVPQNLSPDATHFLTRQNLDKYYSGHQDRLGHYFRHLFQSYVFINESKEIDPTQKKFYGKMLRTQLSLSEQALLFVSSISSLGMKWEYSPEYDKQSKDSFKTEKKNFLLISNYNIIRNLPGDRLIDIPYKNFYPKVKYENDQIINK